MNGRDITQYWKPEIAQANIEAGSDSGAPHSAGEVLRGAREGDRLWVLTSVQGQLHLVQQFVIAHAGLSQREAARLLGARPSEIWAATCHVIGVGTSQLPTELIDVHHLASRLRFVSQDHPRLKFAGKKLDPQSLRSLRVLTPESAALLQQAWVRHTGRLAESPAATSFEPNNIEDARRRIRANIVQRQGQGLFRQSLMRAYRYRCAITGADVAETLEAAHIRPYLGLRTNVVENGLLLRADLHTLFDLGLLTIDPRSMTVKIGHKLRNTSYESLDGKKLRIPKRGADHPSKSALAAHAVDWRRAQRNGTRE